MDGLATIRSVRAVPATEVTPEFDPLLAVLEVRNFDRIARLHLKRCTCPDTAKEIASILAKLTEGFANKIV